MPKNKTKQNKPPKNKTNQNKKPNTVAPPGKFGGMLVSQFGSQNISALLP